MGYHIPKEVKTTSIYRMMNQGGPNSGKTHAFCATWPRPAVIVVAPGEQGDATIPRGQADLIPFVWQVEPIEKVASSVVVQQVEQLVYEVLGGKYGTFQSFCFDGFHKYYGYILDMTSNGKLFKGETLGEPGKDGETDPYSAARIYNRARERARHFVQDVNASLTPNILWTCWDGREADDPAKGFKSTSHIFPGLPGQAAKEFMGEFGLVVHSRILWGQRDPKFIKTAPSRRVAKWQLKPEGDVWGASVKAPIDVVDRLPDYCDQDYNILKGLLENAWASTAGGT